MKIFHSSSPSAPVMANTEYASADTKMITVSSCTGNAALLRHVPELRGMGMDSLGVMNAASCWASVTRAISSGLGAIKSKLACAQILGADSQNDLRRMTGAHDVPMQAERRQSGIGAFAKPATPCHTDESSSMADEMNLATLFDVDESPTTRRHSVAIRARTLSRSSFQSQTTTGSLQTSFNQSNSNSEWSDSDSVSSYDTQSSSSSYSTISHQSERASLPSFSDEYGMYAGKYAGKGDDIEKTIIRDHGPGAIKARGATEILKILPAEGELLLRNMRVAEELAQHAANLLDEPKNHGNALIDTPEGQAIAWLIGGTKDITAIEHARQAFQKMLHLTADRLAWHRQQNGERLVLYRDAQYEDRVAFGRGPADPCHRIFLNERQLDVLLSPFDGPNYLLHEASHQANDRGQPMPTQDYWYLPELGDELPSGTVPHVLSPALEKNLECLTQGSIECLVFVLSALGSDFRFDEGMNMEDAVDKAKQAILSDPGVAARIVPENASSLAVLAAMIGLDVLRENVPQERVISHSAMRPPMKRLS